MLEHREGALRVSRANPVACRLLGAPVAALVDRELSDFLDPAEHDDLARAGRALLSGRSTGWARS